MEVASHWKLLSQGVAWSELLCPESRSFWPLAAVFIFHSLASPRFFLAWLFICLSCLCPCYLPLLLPAPSLLPVSSGLILVFTVLVERLVFPDWYQLGVLQGKIPPEQLLSALSWALVDTATCSLELGINRSQPPHVACLLSAPRSPLMTYKSKQKLLL